MAIRRERGETYPPVKYGQIDEIVNVLKSSGRSRNVNDFSILDIYLNEADHYPYMRSYSELAINHQEFMDEFSPMINKTYYIRENVDEKNLDTSVEYGVYSLGKGYVVEVSVGYNSLDNFSIDVQTFLKKLSGKENTALVSNIVLYYPPESSPLYNKDLSTQLEELIRKHKLDRNSTTPCIGMICYEDGDFYMKDFYIKKDYTIKHGDLHYGKGFMDFHTSLLSRFRNDSKGLVLFHGQPGTGKTYYIRSLIKDLIELGKYVIYLPPNMVESMVEPSMLNFISSVVLEKAEDGKSCVLLLEDAEPLLTSRKTENRSGGITNLLNITDGLLNDMLTIQVIATFNTDISNIDEALLRPERLIARKEFKSLKKEDAQTLANELKIEKFIDKESTLAEIYSQSKHSEILIHEYNSEAKKIGF